MFLVFLVYIFGTILGYLIHRTYLWKSNIICQGPFSKEMESQIHFDLNSKKYYKFKVQTFLCPPSYNR